MSRLDELIAELCPDGVEYKPIREVATVSRGGSFQKKDYVAEGFPCIHYGQIYTTYGLFVNNTISFISDTTAAKQKKAVSGDVIMAVTSENMEDVCKCVAWLGEGEVAVSGHTAIIHHNQNPKYLVYYLRSSLFFAQKVKLAHGTKVIEVRPDSLLDVVIPVPPLPVQREIVRMLDHFTELTAELTTQLTAELTARQKQFEYYRNKLLYDVKEPSIHRLKDVCEISRGKVISKDDIKVNSGEYPVYSSQTENNGELGRINTYMYDGDYLTWTTDGANAGTVFFRSGKFNITNVCGLIKVNKHLVDIRYLFHLLSVEAPKYVSRGMGNPKLMSNVMGSIKIWLPSIQEQERISRKLDGFEIACNSLSMELPVEIAALQKQYEYYHDALLTITKG